jgi:hypothetical protein
MPLPAASFGHALSNPANNVNLRTELVTKDEKNKYKELVKLVTSSDRKELQSLLKSGLLLNSQSNDNSTVLDNLYKIAQNPRAQGLSNRNILRETIAAISNPLIITQQLGDVPVRYAQQAKAASKYNDDFNNAVSGTCVATSVQFDMALKQPAEFVRFVEGLSSPGMSVEKNIKLKNLADNTLDAIWLLNAFEIPFEAGNFDEVKIKFAPDKNALLCAQIQTTNKDPHERSSIDVLMQSTFMQVGSQQSYDSLPDKRAGKFNQNDKGLIEFEKTFLESITQDKNKISVTYQVIDENGKLVGYEADFATIKKHIVDTLEMGENLIIGYTQTDADNKVINGHEITIIGAKTDKTGKMTFVCNDTDDGHVGLIEYSEDYLLPKIHHTALPKSVAEKDVQMVENWVEGLRKYKSMKA